LVTPILKTKTKRTRRRMPTRAELMEMYIKAERTEPKAEDFKLWLLSIRAQADAKQQIEGGA